MHHESAPLYPSATLPLKDNYSPSSTPAPAQNFGQLPVPDTSDKDQYVLGASHTEETRRGRALKHLERAVGARCGRLSKPSTPAPRFFSVHLLLGPENTVTTCPFCHASIKTAVKYTTTSRTHITALLYYLMCCLCCIGYCSDSAKNSDHYCPNCQRFLGTYVK